MRSLACLAFAAFAAAACPVLAAEADAVLLQFKNGDSAREVGIVPPSADVDVSGPLALTVGDDGTIYVLDQHNARVLAVSPERAGLAPQVLTLPADTAAEDLASVRNELFLWSDGVVRLEKTGHPDANERALRFVTGGDVDTYTRSVFAAMGSQAPGPLNDIVEAEGRSVAPDRERGPVIQYVPSRGLGDIVAEVAVRDGRRVEVALRRGGEEFGFLMLAVSVRDPVGTVEVLDVDSTGRPFVLIETIPAGGGTAGTLIARFAPDGTPDRLYEVPIDSGVAFSRRFVAVGPRGDLLFLKTTEARADVVRLAGRAIAPDESLSVARPIDVRPPKAKRPPKVATRVTSREAVVERAIAFETLRWRVDASAYGPDPAPRCPNMNRAQRPQYLNGKLGTEVKGVPYCWGCKTSPEAFEAGLDRGLTAGNVCTRSEIRKRVVGVDCSAFVSEVWGLKAHVTTAAMPAITRPLKNPWSLRPGDALNKPGAHVMLFLRFTADRKVEVMEASPNACAGRVCRNIYPLSVLLRRGYQPVTFSVIKSD
ncbi:hypothetical protein [Chthonobacter rhizosphaerae]|uniref:hypothetical protein n=1 Tax=Chthonobacter rhizosphaerae TaxID=2735553 RepID=UPI0015EF59BD|nr:hypothetical protein [Chthonobacter rhizosphaerae]